MADLLAIARRHGVGAHSYADDSELYRHAPADLCRQRLSRGVVHSRVGQMDVQQSAETEHRQDGLHPSRDASANREGKLSLSNSVASTFIYQLP